MWSRTFQHGGARVEGGGGKGEGGTRPPVAVAGAPRRDRAAAPVNRRGGLAHVLSRGSGAPWARVRVRVSCPEAAGWGVLNRGADDALVLIEQLPAHLGVVVILWGHRGSGEEPGPGGLGRLSFFSPKARFCDVPFLCLPVEGGEHRSQASDASAGSPFRSQKCNEGVMRRTTA